MKTTDLFSHASSAADAAAQLESYKAALDDAARDQAARKAAGAVWVPEQGWQQPEGSAAASALATLEKSVSADVLESLRAELAKTDTLNKDITLTSPLSTGLVPFDLEAPAKMLAPIFTPLRNRIPRVKGQGTSRRFKRITGISGSGTGGLANLSPFISDSSTTAFGSLNLRRGKAFSYAADERSVNYKQMGLSDLVTWSAEFAGMGFQDARQLSQTSLLMASMIADERALLAGRGTDAGVYVGALATPSTAGVTLTARVAAGAEVGNSANIANLFVRISAEGMFGESIASSEITSTALSAVTGRVVDITMTGTGVPGALGYRIYVGTSTGLANQFYVGRTGCWGGTSGAGTAAFTIQFTGAGTGGAPNAGATGSATETASSADAFDGILTSVLDPAQSGVIRSVGSRLSTTNLGVELQDVFATLWSGIAPTPGYSGTLVSATSQGTKARPSQVWASGMDRKQLSDGFKNGGSGNPTFFMNVPQGDTASMRAGQVITAILNQTTGDEVAIDVHPYLPQGVMPVLSESLPIPDSQIPNPFSYVLPQDYMAINWPVIQHTYDVSSYWFGALVSYAPIFHGAVVNILQG